MPEGPLIRQYQKNDAVYVLLGPGAIMRYRVDDHSYDLRRLPVRSVVGEISVLTGLNATASVVLERGATVLKIPAEDFRKITSDPSLKERVGLLMEKRLMTTAEYHQELQTFLEEKEAERMHETPNAELQKKLSFAEAMKEGLAEGKKIKHVFQISRILENSLEAEEFAVEFSKRYDGMYDVEVYGGDTTIPLVFSADGTLASTGYVKMGANAGSGLYSRIMRYLLQGVNHLSARIIEENTIEFITYDPRKAVDIPHSELAAHSPVVAARKGFISTIDNDGLLNSYRVDTILALILDVSTDLERSLKEGSEKRLMDLYGMTIETTIEQLKDAVKDYVKSDDFRALPENVQNLAHEQFDRIDNLARQYVRRN